MTVAKIHNRRGTLISTKPSKTLVAKMLKELQTSDLRSYDLSYDSGFEDALRWVLGSLLVEECEGLSELIEKVSV